MLENLNDLIGKEISFIELDNYMMSKGFYSVFDDGITENIKDDRNIVYTYNDEDQPQVILYFNITINNEPEEVEENFYLQVTGIEF